MIRRFIPRILRLRFRPNVLNNRYASIANRPVNIKKSIPSDPITVLSRDRVPNYVRFSPQSLIDDRLGVE